MLVLVSVFLNFEMSQHMTFPTKSHKKDKHTLESTFFCPNVWLFSGFFCNDDEMMHNEAVMVT